MMDRSALTIVYNTPTMAWLRLHSIFTVVLDNRFPPRGSNHQKFACLKNPKSPTAVLGSIDISRTRWDRADARDQKFGSRSALQEGDARYRRAHPRASRRRRRADLSRALERLYPYVGAGTSGSAAPAHPPRRSPAPPAAEPTRCSSCIRMRTHDEQVRLLLVGGGRVHPDGPRTSTRSRPRAPTSTSKISTFCRSTGRHASRAPAPSRKATDIIFQLGEAIKRGVKVAVVTPSNAEDSTHMFQKYQRDQGALYLQGVASATKSGGGVVIALARPNLTAPTGSTSTRSF